LGGVTAKKKDLTFQYRLDIILKTKLSGVAEQGHISLHSLRTEVVELLSLSQ